jgi:site-specific DNA recombinase
VVLSQVGRKRDSRMEIVTEEAALVRRIFEQFASGCGLKSIANGLNHDGHITKTGNPFSICAVRDILENPFYFGKVRYDRYMNWNAKRRKGKNPSPIIAKGLHPAIIPEPLWEKVQFLRDRKAHASTKRFHGEYLLTGLIRCPQCGGAMTASRTNNKAKDGSPVARMYYSCGNFRSKGSAVCSANSVRKQDAERAVFDRLKQVLTKPHILRAIVRGINDRKVNRVKPLQDELEAVRVRIVEVQAKKFKYLELYEMDDVDRKLFSDRLGQLEADLDRLHAKQSELEFELSGDHSRTVPYEHVRSLIGRFEHLLRLSSFDQCKTLLHLIIRKITLNDKRQIDRIEMAFDETTEQHFLSLAPSAESLAEGAFPFDGKATKLNHKLTFVI